MLYKRLLINGTEYLLAVNQAGQGAPTESTVGAPGVLYMDTSTERFYKCTAAADGVYTWKEFEAGGSGGYYTPSVSQPDDETMEVSFTPSNEKMPAVAPAQIKLPVPDPQDGGGLPEYTDADNGKVLGIVAGNPAWVEATVSGGESGGDTGSTNHGVAWDLVNVTSSNSVVSVSDGASLVAVLTPSDGYTLGDVTVTMGGEALTGVWNADTATVVIASVTGDVVISCAGVEQGGGEVVDTSPVIAQIGYAYRNVSTTNINTYLTASADQCVTKVYEFTPDVAAIEANQYYDAELGYINLADQNACIKHFISAETFLANGGTEVATTYKKAAFFVDGELQSTLQVNLNSQSAEGRFEIASKNVLQKTVNGVAFTLYTDDVENSYAYWCKYAATSVLPVGVNDGDIIFAGKNTQYYGMSNIYENATETVTAEEPTVMMASFDRVYTDTGVYTEDLEPKWDGMFSIHRGMSTAPDNTLQAIWEAKKHGYNCCELDARYSSDGVVMLCHDTTVTGTVDGEEVTYTIAETTAEVLKTVCVGDTNFPNAMVCTLEDAMRLCRRIGMRPEIDYKINNDQIYKDCVALSKKYGLQDDTLHCCYGISYAVIVKTAYEKANLRVDGSLLDSDTTLDGYLTKPGNIYAFYSAAYCGKTDGSNVGENVTNEERILTHKAKGYKMYVWNVTPHLLPDVMQWEPDILQLQSSKDTKDFYALIRELNSFDELVW